MNKSGSIEAQPKVHLAYVVSHPIQYQAPLLRAIASDRAIDLTVFFCSDFSTGSYTDKGFGTEVQWDVPLTSGYRFVVLPRWRETTSPGPLAPISRGFLRHFSRGVNECKFDALWVHGYSSVNSIHAIVAARALGIPVLLRAESWLADRPRSPRKLWAKRVFFNCLRSSVAAVLPIGTRNAEYWAHYFGQRFPAFLMPYAVDNETFAKNSQSAAASVRLRSELSLEPGRPVILFAAKLQRRKHCDDLVEAYLRLIESLPSHDRPHLLIVGDGEEKDRLRRRVEDAKAELVRFAGFRNQMELPLIFSVSTVFVLPSRQEPWGLIVNEAMACRLPVIVSDEVGCAVDLIEPGQNGYTFPAGDVDALAAALAKVLAPGEAERMGANSSARIAHWSFAEDCNGLKAALAYVTKCSLDVPAAEVSDAGRRL